MSKKQDNFVLAMWAAMFLLLALIAGGALWIESYKYEAYKRITGSTMSFGDYLTTQPKITEPPRKDHP